MKNLWDKSITPWAKSTSISLIKEMRNFQAKNLKKLINKDFFNLKRSKTNNIIYYSFFFRFLWR